MYIGNMGGTRRGAHSEVVDGCIRFARKIQHGGD